MSDTKDKKDKKVLRSRNYAAVLYPESAAEDWKEVLTDTKIPVFVSPLHDQDINPDGEKKKPHYHVMLCFTSLKTQEQAKEIFESICAVGCEVVQSLRGYARYLCHLDNPEKHQYSTDDVLALGGADYFATIGLPTDKYKAIKEMMEFCCDNQIYAYADLLEISAQEHMDWFRVLCDSATYVIDAYLKSKYWKVEMQEKKNDRNSRR